MTGKPAKNFHGVGIGPLSKTLAVKRKQDIFREKKIVDSEFVKIFHEQVKIVLYI